MRRMRSTRSKAGQAGMLLASAALFLWCLSASLQAEPPGTKEKSARGAQSFLEEVRPILGRHCLHCHNSEKPKRGLDLSHLETLLKGGKSGLVVAPGNSRGSLLFQVVHEDNKPHMPPKEQLGPEEIRAIGRWIDGLPADFASQDPALDDGLHWAFRKIGAVEIPEVKNKSWVRNPIDSYIASKLEENGLAPSAEAGKDRLLRRASLDILGLPPSVEELDAFLADDSPDAFEKAVDRILASPAYGERWARHWLDLARYAESEGFKSDEIRPNAWRYRDYVIKAFNNDKPYDRFIKEQIAGDELRPDDPDARVATAFNRHYPDESNARNLMQRRQEILNDITDTTTAVFMGLTVACARCHDHKYDPIRQSDYYRLQAFFANTGAADDITLLGEKELQRHREQLARWEEKTRAIRIEMEAIAEPHRRAIIKDYVDKYPPEIQDALNKTPEERTPIQWQMVHKANQYLEPGSYQYIATDSAVEGRLKGDPRGRWQELKNELKTFASLKPADLPIGTGITDVAPAVPETHVLRRGVYDAPKEEVQPGFLQILDPRPAKTTPPKGTRSSGRRMALANILADPNNPLTARVMVNRI